VNPEKAMMRRCFGKDCLRTAQTSVNLREPFHEPRHRAGADGKMSSDLNIVLA
jgi:hypothetical protein